MTGSEVSHDVMTRPEADPGRQETLRVKTITIILVERAANMAKMQWLQHSVFYFQITTKLTDRVKDEEVRGETGDHRGRDHGEHGHGGDNDGGQGS